MMDESVLSIAADDGIKPYRIHVSSKYLDLTKRKLELTRLPHELLLPQSREWEQGTPKSEIEPLIDFWLEQYSWRTQESHLNTTLPQFKTTIPLSSSSTPFRIHFIHIKSPHDHAFPLLLLPTFPLTNLSLSTLLKPLTNPEDPQINQPFHVIAPSIPGLGFGDAFTAVSGPDTSVLEDTAYLFNALMLKLGYEYYIASSTGSGINSPANVDYHIPRILGSKYSNNCLGIHLIDPPVQSPSLSFSPLGWTKFTIAKFFHAPIFGYTSADWVALKENRLRSQVVIHQRRALPDSEANLTNATPLVSRPLPSALGLSGTPYGAIGLLGFREPNTLAYALCDSPVGLLSLVLNGLQRVSPGHTFSRTEVISLTQLAWLPGPEGAMRFWSGAEMESRKTINWSPTPTSITVFLGSGEGSGNLGGYVCPPWAGERHKIVWSKRQEGRGGLVALERTDAIIEGIRGLVDGLTKIDSRLAIRRLEEVIVDDDVAPEDEPSAAQTETGHDGDDVGLDVESPNTVVFGPAS